MIKTKREGHRQTDRETDRPAYPKDVFYVATIFVPVNFISNGYFFVTLK